MKIGVLTFHRCINYGSYWQARHLLAALATHGHRAVLLDHTSARVDRAEWRCALRPLLPTPVPPADRTLYRHKLHTFMEAFEALPRSAPFDLDQPESAGEFDLVVVGSDEVWNLRHPWYGHKRLFFGDGLRTKRLIAYAASFGNHPTEQGLPAHWAEALRRFEHISVRDENSRAIVSHALGTEPELALDPCFLTRPQQENSGSMPAACGRVLVYGHNFSDWFIAQVQRWAREHSARLASIGYRNDWADEQWITAGPQDFAAAMESAQAVVTNFFHGCVFALRGGKTFICEDSFYRSIKIRDLMSSIGGERHLVGPHTPAAEYTALLSQPLAPAIQQRLQVRRQSSNRFLAQALGQALHTAPVPAC